MNQMTNRFDLLFVLGIILWLVPVQFASSQEMPTVRQRLNAANERVRQGDYQGAIEAFQTIENADELSRVLAYDHAVAQYRTGNFDAAYKLFSEATSSQDSPLAAMSHYNAGNCLLTTVQQAIETSAETKLDELAGKLRAAIDHYRTALRINRADNDARANLEIAVKLLNEIEAQQQQQEQQQGQQQDPDKESSSDEKQEDQNDDSKGEQNPERNPGDDKQPSEKEEQPEQKEPEQKEPEQKEPEQKEPEQKEPEQNPDETKQDEQQSESDSKQEDSGEAGDKKNEPEESQSPSENPQNSEAEQQDDKTDQQSENAQPRDRNDDASQDPQSMQNQDDDSQPESEESPDSPEPSTVPQEGELKQANQMDQPKASETSAAVVSPGKMTAQEAQKMLQAIRDREMLRRFRLQDLQRRRRVTVEKDW